MKKNVTLLCLLLLPLLVCSQDLNIIWQKTIGGSGSDIGLGANLVTSDGGFLLVGFSSSPVSGDKTEPSYGSSDYWVVKLDESGNMLWDKTLGGSDYERAVVAIETDDGGFIIGGGWSSSDVSGNKTSPADGGGDIWLVKLDSQGEIVWQNSIGGSSWDLGADIIKASDGGFIVAGWSQSDASGDKNENTIGEFGLRDFWIFKLTEDGILDWQNTVGGNDSEGGPSISATADGGYIVAGSSESGISGDKTESNIGERDNWIVKFDQGGNVQWDKTIGGLENDYPNKIIELQNGSFLVVGHSDSGISGDKDEENVGERDWWVYQLNTSGEIQWQNTIGGDSADYVYEAIVKDNGYIISGHSKSNTSGDKTEDSNGDYDIWMMKIDLVGQPLWQYTIGGDSLDFGIVKETLDGNFVILGSTRSGISGDFTDENNGERDYFILKFGAPLSIQEVVIGPNILAYPNPFSEILYVEYRDDVKMEVYNLLGELVLQSNSKSIDLNDVNAGTYVVKIFNRDNELISVNKVVKE